MSEIIISNKMTSKYNLVAVRDCHVEVSLTVGNYKDNDIPVEISVRSLKSNIKQVQLDVKHGRTSSINVQIQPIIFSSIPVEIEVNPHNKMTARYELKEPPVSIYDELPVQDSFVVSDSPYNTINYGSNNSMVVGIDSKGNNIGLMQFDLDKIEKDILVKSAKVKLHYTILNEFPNLVLNTLDKSWSELGVTYNNKPINQYFVTNEYTVNREARFIEFDITDTVIEWLKGVPNHGLSLSSSNGFSIFRTRETQLAPELTIEYYSSLPSMVKSSRKNVEISANKLRTNSINVEVEVLAIFKFSTIPVQIHAHRPEDFYFSDKPVEIIVNRNQVNVEITPSFKRKSTIDVQVACGTSSTNIKEVEIEVPSYDRESIQEVEITIQRYNESSIPVEISARRNYKNRKSTQDVEITVVRSSESNVFVEIESYRNYKSKTSDIDVEISIQRQDSSSIPIQIESYRNYKVQSSSIEVEITSLRLQESTSEIEVQIEVPFFEESSTIEVEIYARALGVSNQDVEIEVFRPYRYRDIFKEVELRARVLYISSIPIEITIAEVEKESYSYIRII